MTHDIIILTVLTTATETEGTLHSWCFEIQLHHLEFQWNEVTSPDSSHFVGVGLASGTSTAAISDLVYVI